MGQAAATGHPRTQDPLRQVSTLAIHQHTQQGAALAAIRDRALQHANGLVLPLDAHRLQQAVQEDQEIDVCGMRLHARTHTATREHSQQPPQLSEQNLGNAQS